MKKILLCIALVATMAVSLAGCGTTELRTMSMFGGTDPHAEVYQELLSAFEDANGVTVNDNSATSDEVWKTTVLSTFYSGTQPDVLFYFNGATAKPLVDNKYVVSLEEIRKEYPDFAKNIAPAVLDGYCVPIKGFVEGIFVNKALFTGTLAPYLEKSNWTWDEFLAVGDLLEANGKVPVAFNASQEPHYWIEHSVLHMAGKDAFSNIPTAAMIEEASNATVTKWSNGLKLIGDAADAGMFGPNKGYDTAATAKQAFKDGNAAMYLDGSWFAGQIDSTTTCKPENLMMVPFPTVPAAKGGTGESYLQSGFTSGFYISRKAWDDTAKRDLAVKFVENMISTAAITKFCEETGGIPADASVEVPDSTVIQKSMNLMPTKTTAAVLPLSDAAKAGSFTNLVAASNSFVTKNDAGIKAALLAFANAQ